MRTCFGLAACYDARTDYCKACPEKEGCAKQAKSTVEKIQSAGKEQAEILVAESQVMKEKLAERLEQLAKHPRKLVESLISQGVYVKTNILRAGQANRGKKVFWHAVSLLRQNGQLERRQIVNYAVEQGMSPATANSEATAALKALEFYEAIIKNGKQYRLNP